MLTISKLVENDQQDLELYINKNNLVVNQSVLNHMDNFFLLKDNKDIIGYTYFDVLDKQIEIQGIHTICNDSEEKTLMIDLLLKSVINSADIRGKYQVEIKVDLIKDNIQWLKNMGFEQEEDKLHIDVKKYFNGQCSGCNKACNHA